MQYEGEYRVQKLRQMTRPDVWTDPEIKELMVSTLLPGKTSRFGVTRSDVTALAWIMATMSTTQQKFIEPVVTYAMVRMLQVDHPDIKDDYITGAISDCFDLIPAALVDKRADDADVHYQRRRVLPHALWKGRP